MHEMMALSRIVLSLIFMGDACPPLPGVFFLPNCATFQSLCMAHSDSNQEGGEIQRLAGAGRGMSTENSTDSGLWSCTAPESALDAHVNPSKLLLSNLFELLDPGSSCI
jgi:hypothetical protein